MEALHEKEVAHDDHTTLLLNCYAKLKKERKMDEFLDMAGTSDDTATGSSDGQAGASGAAGSKSKPSFDVDVAIRNTPPPCSVAR